MEKDLINILKEKDMSTLLPFHEAKEKTEKDFPELASKKLVFLNKFYSK